MKAEFLDTLEMVKRELRVLLFARLLGFLLGLLHLRAGVSLLSLPTSHGDLFFNLLVRIPQLEETPIIVFHFLGDFGLLALHLR